MNPVIRKKKKLKKYNLPIRNLAELVPLDASEKIPDYRSFILVSNDQECPVQDEIILIEDSQYICKQIVTHHNIVGKHVGHAVFIDPS